jgi:hypothetical protein
MTIERHGGWVASTGGRPGSAMVMRWEPPYTIITTPHFTIRIQRRDRTNG